MEITLAPTTIRLEIIQTPGDMLDLEFPVRRKMQRTSLQRSRIHQKVNNANDFRWKFYLKYHVEDEKWSKFHILHFLIRGHHLMI